MDVEATVTEERLLREVQRALATYGWNGSLAVVISVSGRYAEFQFGQSRKGVTCWQMPLDNRSNATFRQLVDDVVEHLLAILTRPEVAA